jgi:hypothetical protein
MLITWETHKRAATGQHLLGYSFTEEGREEPLFSGEDFGCSPMVAIDSDDALRCLLGFLTLRPGDTDDEYFSEYTQDQMAFAKGPAEELQMWALDDEPEGEFVDIF